MDKIKKGLGRGLSSLIGETKIEPQKNQVSISDLVPNKYQPRKIFDETSLEDLTKSIKERGMIQPIIVRISNDDKSKYEIIAGERRWLAAQRAGLHDVPVVVTEADDLKSLEFAIVENVQRHDLNPLEEAQGYKRLIDDFSLKHFNSYADFNAKFSLLGTIYEPLLKDLLNDKFVNHLPPKSACRTQYSEDYIDKYIDKALTLFS